MDRRSSLKRIMKDILRDIKKYEPRDRASGALRVVPKSKQSSSKTKLKATKSRPHKTYASTKPVASKSTKQFRNKSNLR